MAGALKLGSSHGRLGRGAACGREDRVHTRPLLNLSPPPVLSQASVRFVLQLREPVSRFVSFFHMVSRLQLTPNPVNVSESARLYLKACLSRQLFSPQGPG